jgi:hypothetical protein
VCGGDGKSCLGCDGVPNSGKKNDSCGQCGGPGPDACGTCGGNGSGCAGCDGVPNSGKKNDACGVCGGNGSSCAGCDGVPNSGKKNDACGVCGGNGSTCAGCDGVANSGKKNDACGVCGGNGSTCTGCDGVPNSGKKTDACGVCGGNGSTCAGCDGVPNSGKKKDACGVCGGPASGSTCPMVGTYAVRGIVYGKGKSGSTVSGSKAISFGLVKISTNGDGTLKLIDQVCYSETLPITGQTAYAWTKPAWSQATPPLTRSLTYNSDGTWSRVDPSTPLGWSPDRRPSSCSDSNPSGSATPLSPWPANGGGNTCTCNRSTDALPPFDKSAPYDCRLVDSDQDGYPAGSAFISDSPPPADRSADPSSGAFARLLIASNTSGGWTITPAANRNHTATSFDTGGASVVGCIGGLFSPCTVLNSSPVGSVCPERFNKIQMIAVDDSYTCGSVFTNRSSLFASVNDGSLPDDSVCPPPP